MAKNSCWGSPRPTKGDKVKFALIGAGILVLGVVVYLAMLYMAAHP